MDRAAVIDVGTNSIKFILAEKAEDGLYKTLIEGNRVVKLGVGLEKTGAISPAAMSRGSMAIREFAGIARSGGANQIIAVGTMALRSALNSKDFLEAVKRDADISIRIISGDEEARYSFLAVISGMCLGQGNTVIIDTGGGSTEFVSGIGDSLNKRLSLNIGAIGITEVFLGSDPVGLHGIEPAISYIDKYLTDHGIDKWADRLVGMGGGITAMTSVMLGLVEYDPDKVQGSFLSLDEVERQIVLYSTKTIEERRSIPGLKPERADVILASALIVKAIMGRLGLKGLTVSDRGLRHGLLYEMAMANSFGR